MNIDDEQPRNHVPHADRPPLTSKKSWVPSILTKRGGAYSAAFVLMITAAAAIFVVVGSDIATFLGGVGEETGTIVIEGDKFEETGYSHSGTTYDGTKGGVRLVDNKLDGTYTSRVYGEFEPRIWERIEYATEQAVAINGAAAKPQGLALSISFDEPQEDQIQPPDSNLSFLFDEADGATSFIDSQGGTHPCENADSCPAPQADEQRQRISTYDGVDDHITIEDPSNIVPGPNEGSVAFWINPTEVKYPRSFISRTNLATWEQMNWAIMGGYDNNVIFRFRDDAANQTKNVSSAAKSVQPNDWSHVTATWKKTADNKTTIALYVNGKFEQRATADFLMGDTRPLQIGRMGAPHSGHTNPYKGQMDDLMFFNSALTEAQAIALWDGSTIVQKTYQSDQDTVSVCAGAFCPGQTAGKTGNALSLDGQDDYLEFQPNEGSPTDTGTISMWVKTDKPQYPKAFFARGSQARWDQVNLLIRGNQDTSLAFTLRPSTDNTTAVHLSTPPNSIQPDTWHHVAGTWEKVGDNQTVATLFLDGEKVADQELEFVVGSNHPFQIGRWGEPYRGNMNNAKGAVDNLQLLSQPLDVAEIRLLAGLDEPQQPADPQTNMTFEYRTCDDSVCDIASDWMPCPEGACSPEQKSLYIQARAKLASDTEGVTDVLKRIAIDYRALPCEEFDYDEDGYNACDDCNDYDPEVNPGASELCGDSIDNNCNDSEVAECATACSRTEITEDQEYELNGFIQCIDEIPTQCVISSSGEVSWVPTQQEACTEDNPCYALPIPGKHFSEESDLPGYQYVHGCALRHATSKSFVSNNAGYISFANEHTEDLRKECFVLQDGLVYIDNNNCPELHDLYPVEIGVRIDDEKSGPVVSYRNGDPTACQNDPNCTDKGLDGNVHVYRLEEPTKVQNEVSEDKENRVLSMGVPTADAGSIPILSCFIPVGTPSTPYSDSPYTVKHGKAAVEIAGKVHHPIHPFVVALISLCLLQQAYEYEDATLIEEAGCVKKFDTYMECRNFVSNNRSDFCLDNKEGLVCRYKNKCRIKQIIGSDLFCASIECRPDEFDHCENCGDLAPNTCTTGDNPTPHYFSNDREAAFFKLPNDYIAMPQGKYCDNCNILSTPVPSRSRFAASPSCDCLPDTDLDGRPDICPDHIPASWCREDSCPPQKCGEFGLPSARCRNPKQDSDPNFRCPTGFCDDCQEECMDPVSCVEKECVTKIQCSADAPQNRGEIFHIPCSENENLQKYKADGTLRSTQCKECLEHKPFCLIPYENLYDYGCVAELPDCPNGEKPVFESNAAVRGLKGPCGETFIRDLKCEPFTCPEGETQCGQKCCPGSSVCSIETNGSETCIPLDECKSKAMPNGMWKLCPETLPWGQDRLTSPGYCCPPFSSRTGSCKPPNADYATGCYM
ncbi:LamG-like jellyroll fold domain-containing protein [Patescibacteria group bacterium]